jgi:hypothetical protein
MEPVIADIPRPAKRIMVFSSDGGRADRFFEVDAEGKPRAPFLVGAAVGKGTWGVSDCDCNCSEGCTDFWLRYMGRESHARSYRKPARSRVYAGWNIRRHERGHQGMAAQSCRV